MYPLPSLSILLSNSLAFVSFFGLEYQIMGLVCFVKIQIICVMIVWKPEVSNVFL